MAYEKIKVCEQPLFADRAATHAMISLYTVHLNQQHHGYYGGVDEHRRVEGNDSIASGINVLCVTYVMLYTANLDGRRRPGRARSPHSDESLPDDNMVLSDQEGGYESAV